MAMGQELGIMLAYGIGILALYVIGYIFMFPIKMIMKLVFNSIIGAVGLFVLNFVAAPVGLHIPINIISAVVTGVLGIPGVALLGLYEYFLR